MNADHHPQHPLGPFIGSDLGIDDQVRRYRDERRRRHQEQKNKERRDQQRRCIPSREEEIIQFAVIWAPYGVPSDEETYQRFGMSTRQFFETVRDLLHLGKCPPETQSRLTMYADPTGTLPDQNAK